VPARAAEPVIKIEMTKGGVEIVAPHQADDAPAEPNTFRVSGRTVDRLRRFREFVGLALAILGRIRGIGGRLAGLIGVSALGNGASDTNHECKPGDGKVTQNRNLKL
jgi:hypothetical protein